MTTPAHDHHALPEAGADPALASSDPTASPRLSIRGYGDVGFSGTRGRAPSNTFALGQIDLFITSRISERLGVLVETVLEPGVNNRLGVDLERVLLQYRASPYLQIEAGRFHSSVGYFNTAFHHGTWFQTAIGRPKIFAFEDDGGPLPIHNVGVTASGRIPSGRFGARYFVELGNGRNYSAAEAVQIRVDGNPAKSVNAGFTASPEALPGLEFGASYYRDRIDVPDGLARRQSILAVHAVYQYRRIEWLNEAIWMRHRALVPSAPRTTSLPGGYSQLSYRMGAWRPYFRFDMINGTASDPVAQATLGLSERWRAAAAGIRYDFAEFAAIKFQADRESDRTRQVSNRFALQLAFTF